MSHFGGRIMCKAAEVGKIVVNKCIDLNLPIDVQKLQKLLVLMQVECIKLSSEPLFREDIVIWNCGVAIKEVDEEFRNIGTPFENHQIEYISLLDREKKCVDYVIKMYGDKSAIDLSKLPILQKVCTLGEKLGDSHVPRVNLYKLMGVFAQK